MARIEKKIQQIKEQESFFPETTGIVDESEDMKFETALVDEEPIMNELKSKPE